MQYQLINKTRTLLVIPLRSGAAVHVGPGQRSGPVEEIELADNDKVAKMKRLGMLNVVAAQQQ